MEDFTGTDWAVEFKAVTDRLYELRKRFSEQCGINVRLQNGASGRALALSYGFGGSGYIAHYTWPQPLDYANSPTNGWKEALEAQQVLLDAVDEDHFKPDGWYGDCYGGGEAALCGDPVCRTCGPMYAAYWAEKEDQL